MVYLFYKRHLAELEDSLKDARRKQQFARVDNLRAQILGIRAVMGGLNNEHSSSLVVVADSK